ncbi:MAG: phosphoribosyltransferase family protein [Bacteroidetes bacterium]|nr:phosphoribosyltransferase family protein [Bacteroidota bacterium]
MSLVEDFISLIFPNNCAACGNNLFEHEEVICSLCEFHLPQTNYHMDYDNPVAVLFWGRARIKSAAAYYHFNKGNKVQHLVHLLKYKGRCDVGIFLGKQYGQYLKNAPLFRSAQVIVPVPLHRKKLLKRGYNQSEQFALGLGISMNLPLDSISLKRTHASQTQTRKSRFNRWENVSGIFEISDRQRLKDKHILLVDDVITTGSTLEACIVALQSIPGIQVSVAAIATAMI